MGWGGWGRTGRDRMGRGGAGRDGAGWGGTEQDGTGCDERAPGCLLNNYFKKTKTSHLSRSEIFLIYLIFQFYLDY